jgi:hypothetical protein
VSFDVLPLQYITSPPSPYTLTIGKIRGLILRNQIITILKYYLPGNYITREQLENHIPDPDEDWKHLLPEEAFAVSLQVSKITAFQLYLCSEFYL